MWNLAQIDRTNTSHLTTTGKQATQQSVLTTAFELSHTPSAPLEAMKHSYLGLKSIEPCEHSPPRDMNERHRHTNDALTPSWWQKGGAQSCMSVSMHTSRSSSCPFRHKRQLLLRIPASSFGPSVTRTDYGPVDCSHEPSRRLPS